MIFTYIPLLAWTADAIHINDHNAFIYIVIHRQTVSLYHNFSEWVNTREVSSRDRNLADFRVVGYLTAVLCHPQRKRKKFYVYIRYRLPEFFIHEKSLGLDEG